MNMVPDLANDSESFLTWRLEREKSGKDSLVGPIGPIVASIE
jgi:hypothetical protein